MSRRGPLDLVDKPPAGDGETETVDAKTIADLIAAYRVLEGDAEDDQRLWFEAARAGKGRTRARLLDGAVRARPQDELPGRGGAESRMFMTTEGRE